VFLLRETTPSLRNTQMMKALIIVLFAAVYTPTSAMAYGKVFPTHFPMKNPPGTARLIVKNVSEVQEFAELVHEEDNARRLLELREGISKAKASYVPCFTFRRICGTKYADVFGNKN
jgi:hypothetical protein